MLKIRRSRDRRIFNTGIHIMTRRHPYIETAPVICVYFRAAKASWFHTGLDYSTFPNFGIGGGLRSSSVSCLIEKRMKLRIHCGMVMCLG